MQPPARFIPQHYNSPDLVLHPNTAEPASWALLNSVSPCMCNDVRPNRRILHCASVIRIGLINQYACSLSHTTLFWKQTVASWRGYIGSERSVSVRAASAVLHARYRYSNSSYNARPRKCGEVRLMEIRRHR